MPPSRGLMRSRFSNNERGLSSNAKQSRRSATTDSNILRGAAIIRQQIQSQWEHDDDEFVQKQNHDDESYRPSSSSSSSAATPEKLLNEDHTHSFSDDDEIDDVYDDDFSDPWGNNQSHIIKEVAPVIPQVVTAAAATNARRPEADASSFTRTTGSDMSFTRTKTFESRGDASQWADVAMQEQPAVSSSSKSKGTGAPRHPLRLPSKNPNTVLPSFPPAQLSLLDSEDQQQFSALPATYIVEPLHLLTYDDEEEEERQNGRPGYDFVEQDDDDEDDAGDFNGDNDDINDEEEDLFHHSYLPQEYRAPSSRRLMLGDEPPFLDDDPVVLVDDNDVIMDILSHALMREKRELAVSSNTYMTMPSPSLVPNTIAMEVPSPLSPTHKTLLGDPAFLHAQSAGHLWQSIVGNHIRFPKSWWEQAKTPPMGIDSNKRDTRGWWYHGRDSTYNPLLHRYVKHRSAPGRILLHVIVRDAQTWIPLQDLVVGCFHPAARFIRETEHADPNQDDCRDLWLAVRKRCDTTTSIDQLLSSHKQQHGQGGSSSCCWPTLVGPLGPDQRMTNQNVRATFGEKPPLETIFVPEPDLYERLAASNTVSPAMVLLREFVFA